MKKEMLRLTGGGELYSESNPVQCPLTAIASQPTGVARAHPELNTCGNWCAWFSTHDKVSGSPEQVATCALTGDIGEFTKEHPANN